MSLGTGMVSGAKKLSLSGATATADSETAWCEVPFDPSTSYSRGRRVTLGDRGGAAGQW